MTSIATTDPKEVTIDNVPERGIIMYYGDITMIPNGWALCDGTGGVTPDLRDRFIVGGTLENNKVWGEPDALPDYIGSGTTLATDPAGGHSHNAANWFSLHNTSGSRDVNVSIDAGNNLTDYVNDHTHKITGDITSKPQSSNYQGKPKWYALAFIMKLPTS